MLAASINIVVSIQRCLIFDVLTTIVVAEAIAVLFTTTPIINGSDVEIVDRTTMKETDMTARPLIEIERLATNVAIQKTRAKAPKETGHSIPKITDV